MPSIACSATSFSQNDPLRNHLMALGHPTSFNTNKLSEQALASFINDAEVLLVGREPVSQAVLQRCPQLKLIAKYGVGLDNIDLNACQEMGVEVKYTPGVNKNCVAELTLGFMLTLIHNMYQSSIQLKNGQWVKNGGRELSGKTIGIIGVGQVGKALIGLLRPFQCKIMVNDIRNQEAYYQTHGLIEASKETIYQKADIITIHTPLTPQTENLINKDVFSQLKNQAILINTARGGIVNEQDLFAALEENQIAAAAQDVFVEEPSSFQALLDHPRFFGTPHIAGNAEEAVQAMGQTAINAIKNFLNSA